MFNRALNKFKDYTKDKTVRQMSVEEIQEAIKKMEEIVLPAINERTKSVNEARKKKFDKEKTITEFTKGDQVMVRVRNKQGKLDAEYEGPYTIVRKNKGGAYTLKDLQGELELRDHVPSELKLVLPRKDVNAEDKNFTVDKIVAHRKDSNSSYSYKVRWKGYTPEEDTWETPSSFNDPLTITSYWRRIGEVEPTKAKGKRKLTARDAAAITNKKTRSKKRA